MSKNYSKQEDAIYDELFDMQIDMFWKISDLRNAKWDSPTLKQEIEVMIDHGHKLHEELGIAEDRNKENQS